MVKHDLPSGCSLVSEVMTDPPPCAGCGAVDGYLFDETQAAGCTVATSRRIVWKLILPDESEAGRCFCLRCLEAMTGAQSPEDAARVQAEIDARTAENDAARAEAEDADAEALSRDVAEARADLEEAEAAEAAAKKAARKAKDRDRKRAARVQARADEAKDREQDATGPGIGGPGKFRLKAFCGRVGDGYGPILDREQARADEADREQDATLAALKVQMRGDNAERGDQIGAVVGDLKELTAAMRLEERLYAPIIEAMRSPKIPPMPAPVAALLAALYDPRITYGSRSPDRPSMDEIYEAAALVQDFYNPPPQAARKEWGSLNRGDRESLLVCVIDKEPDGEKAIRRLSRMDWESLPVWVRRDLGEFLASCEPAPVASAPGPTFGIKDNLDPGDNVTNGKRPKTPASSALTGGIPADPLHIYGPTPPREYRCTGGGFSTKEAAERNLREGEAVACEDGNWYRYTKDADPANDAWRHAQPKTQNPKPKTVSPTKPPTPPLDAKQEAKDAKARLTISRAGFRAKGFAGRVRLHRGEDFIGTFEDWKAAAKFAREADYIHNGPAAGKGAAHV